MQRRLTPEAGAAIAKTNWFELVKTDAPTGARLGRLKTPHGEVPTPVFMPVGSQATVKGATPQQLGDVGIKMILCNNYHLYLRPGIEVVQKMGGLHRFMHWDGAILTDSGGFQIFSLARLRAITGEGVKFRSHIDGSEHFITPELATQYQEALGADVIMALDICPSHQDDEGQVREAMDTTHKWALRCLKAHRRPDQALFGIIQGGFNPKWRLESVSALTAMDFAGYAIGGLSLGEPKEQTRQILQVTCPALPENQARYLMGVGSPEDILLGVECGVDMFDCVLPTRVARNGSLFTSAGRLNIRNAIWKDTPGPLEADCKCYLCRNFSAAYLHHLFRADELLAYTLATLHNLTFLQDFMQKIRQAIAGNDFGAFKTDFLGRYRTTDENIRLAQKQKWLKNRQTLDQP